jgi:diaminopimelate epimerase
MQGTGNDFIIINCLTQKFRFSYSNLTKYLCNRKYGVGADGVIFIENSEVADYKMRIFNKDGSEAGMCGNGIRCLGKYLYEEGLIKKQNLKIETVSGIKNIELSIEGKTVTYIKVDMGNPIFEYNKIPVIFPNVMHTELEQLELSVKDKKYIGFPISMGNPHVVIFVDNLESINLEEEGKIIENYKYFPNKTNVEFVKVINKNKIKMLVWERGVGRTLSCGTGACASAVISTLKKSTNNELIVDLEGGNLKINYDKENNNVTLIGTAETVFKRKY